MRFCNNVILMIYYLIICTQWTYMVYSTIIHYLDLLNAIGINEMDCFIGK